MTEITEQVIEKVLAVYNPKQRILLGGKLEYPNARGLFKIGHCFYTVGDFKHATDIEIQLCLNQLCYAAAYRMIKDETPELFREMDFNKLQKEGMVIVESRKRFRKPIPTDKEIYGEIIFRRLLKRKNNVFANVDFEFENRSCIGNLELAVIN